MVSPATGDSIVVYGQIVPPTREREKVGSMSSSCFFSFSYDNGDSAAFPE
jgi:hypothetical protein